MSAAFSICQLPVTAFGRFFVWLDSFDTAFSEGMALVCEHVVHPRQCQCQIRTIGSLRIRTTPRRKSAPRWGIC